MSMGRGPDASEYIGRSLQVLRLDFSRFVWPKE